MAGRIELEAEKLIQDLLSNTEYELVDLEYVKEKNWYLRIFIDKNDGIDPEFCIKTNKKALPVQHVCGVGSFIFWQKDVVYFGIKESIAKVFLFRICS